LAILIILVNLKRAKQSNGFFVGLPNVKEVLAKGDTKSSIITKEDIQVDLRVVEMGSFGAAVQYFTGSKSHNVHLRELAIKKNLKLNEYGIFDLSSDKKLVEKKKRKFILFLIWISFPQKCVKILVK